MMDNAFLPSAADLYTQWKQDRELQRRMPLRQMWRGVLGLAMMVHGFDEHAIPLGDRTLLPNHAVSWIAVQDIPPGYFPISRTWNHFGVTLAMETRATLAYGFPKIDFSECLRDSVNLKLDPLLAPELGYTSSLDIMRDRRRCAVMLQVTRAMTEAAYYGINDCGQPLRIPWHRDRPDNGRGLRLDPPSAWMPRACAVFDVHTLRQAPSDQWLPIHMRRLGWEVSAGKWAIPFDEIVGRLRLVRPSDLLWDVSGAESFLWHDLETFVFPAIQMADFRQPQVQLPGVVRLTGSIVTDRAIYAKKLANPYSTRRSAA